MNDQGKSSKRLIVLVALVVVLVVLFFFARRAETPTKSSSPLLQEQQDAIDKMEPGHEVEGNLVEEEQLPDDDSQGVDREDDAIQL